MKYEGVDLKEIVYRYENDVFLFNSYSVKRKFDYRYYAIIMVNLLIIIYLKRKDIDSILVVFDNIYFEKDNYLANKQFTEYDIVRFQFIIAIIYFILYVYKNEEKKVGRIDKEFIDKVSELVNAMKNEQK